VAYILPLGEIGHADLVWWPMHLVDCIEGRTSRKDSRVLRRESGRRWEEGRNKNGMDYVAEWADEWSGDRFLFPFLLF
jgi:hypothetical protein